MMSVKIETALVTLFVDLMEEIYLIDIYQVTVSLTCWQKCVKPLLSFRENRGKSRICLSFLRWGFSSSLVRAFKANVLAKAIGHSFLQCKLLS